MLHSFAQYPATQELTGSHLDEFFDRPNPASLKYVRPKNPPKCGQKSITADMRSILSSLIHDFSATYIDHTLASVLLYRSSSAQVGDSVV